jgi:hypothetical protein
MMKRTKLPTIVLGRSMRPDAPTQPDPHVTFELEAETGEVFEVCFSLRGMLSTTVMALNWSTLVAELEQLEPPTKVSRG